MATMHFEWIGDVLEEVAQQRAILENLIACPVHCLIAMWKSWDGETDVLGYSGEMIHFALNHLGHGHVCAV